MGSADALYGSVRVDRADPTYAPRWAPIARYRRFYGLVFWVVLTPFSSWHDSCNLINAIIVPKKDFFFQKKLLRFVLAYDKIPTSSEPNGRSKGVDRMALVHDIDSFDPRDWCIPRGTWIEMDGVHYEVTFQTEDICVHMTQVRMVDDDSAVVYGPIHKTVFWSLHTTIEREVEYLMAEALDGDRFY